MPEGPGSDDQYRWLYRNDPDATQRIPDRDADADATQAMPPAPAPGTPPATPPPAERDRGRPDRPPGSELPPPVLPPAGSQPVGTPPPSQPPRRSRARIVRRVLLGLVLVWIVFLIMVPIWAWSQIEEVDAEPDGERPGEQPGTTYLLVGSDSREDLTEAERQDLSTGNAEGERTDTIMLLHSGAGPTTLVSLPRDSIVEIPGEGSTKINAAFAFGGPKLLVETVELNTGIRIDGYVEIGLGGFVSVVDALGGVEVCPKEAIDDRKAGLDIEAGCQELTGPEALGYARTRDFGIGDIQRVQNQREVVSAIADDAASPWTLLNPWRYLRLSAAGADSLRIGEDVGPIDLARFAWAMGEVSGGGKTCTVPISNLDVTWNPELSEQLFRLIREDRTDEISDELCRASGLAPAPQ